MTVLLYFFYSSISILFDPDLIICSNAWIKLENKDPIQINTVSDSVIVSGILYLLEEVFNGEPKSSIVDYDGQELIDDLGLQGTISSQRLRGFAEAIRMMKSE